MLKRLFTLFNPHKKKIITLLLMMIISAGINALLPIIISKIIDQGIIEKKFIVLETLPLVSLILVLFEECIGILEVKYAATISAMIQYTLAKNAFKHLTRVRVDIFNNTNPTQIMTNLNMDMANMTQITNRNTLMVILEVFKFFGAIIGLVIINWKLAAMLITLLPVKYLLVRYFTNRRMTLYGDYMQYISQYAYWFGDAVNGIREVKLWGLDRYKIHELNRKWRTIINANIRLELINKFIQAGDRVIDSVITTVFYIAGGVLIFKDNLTLGNLTAFIAYSSIVTNTFSMIMNVGYAFSIILPSSRRFFDFMDLEEENEECTSKRQAKNTDISGRIEFDNVSFSYNKEKAALRKISFTILPGEKIALIGTNGSGKTTLLNLMIKLYKPSQGKILLDGIDIRYINTKEYRKNFATVLQNAYIFDGTIRQNIALFAPMRETKIVNAAVASQAEEFVQKLPDKYETRLTANGGNISGGQRQKIAIARAFARQAKIIVLDEAASNYDIDSRIRLNRILGKNFTNKTMIVITHNMDVIKQMDRVFLLHEGTLVDNGKHHEVFARNALYRKILMSSEKNSPKA